MGLRNCRFLLSATTIVLFGMVQNVMATVGKIDASFDVTEKGSANYQIPIHVPAGPNGLQPRLTISYDSNGSDGTMGPGWRISGLSQITRCLKTFAQDGAAAAISLTATDRYCLDGKRLKLASGTYGSDSSVYYTEIADFSKVTAYGVAGNGPAYFLVQAKNGLTYEYGNSADSRVLATGTATASYWLLSKVRDRSGNNYIVNYGTGQTGSTGIGVPLTLSYTPTSTGSSSYSYSINFQYGLADGFSDQSGYVAGTSVSNTNRLDKITIKNGASTIKNYAFTYESSPVSKRSRLTQIDECSDDALSDCVSPTKITYQTSMGGIASPSNTGWTVETTGYGYPSKIQVADFNGDGRKDVLVRDELGSTGGRRTYVSMATATGYSSPQVLVDNGGVYDPLLIGDYDGDGDEDILYGSGTTWTLFKWNGVSAFSSSSVNVSIDTARYSAYFGANTATVDANADGLPDLLMLHTDGKVYLRLNTSTGGVVSFSTTQSIVFDVASISGSWNIAGSMIRGDFDPEWVHTPVRKVDFNGDGRGDLVLVLASSSGSGAYSAYALASNSLGGYTVASTLISSAFSVPVNFNNDACTDWSDSWARLSSCDGGVAYTTVSGGYGSVIVDWNGDGLTDSFYNTSTNPTLLQIALSKGDTTGFSGYSETKSFPYIPIYTTGPVPLDVNGDGMDDLLYFYATSVTYPTDDPDIYTTVSTWHFNYGLHEGSGTLIDAVAAITDGFGVSYQPQFVSITNANYTKGSGASYPEKDIQRSMFVVGQVAITDASATSSTYTKSYSYAGARDDLTGRGFLGFQSITVTDSRANAPVVKTYYKTAFPYTGMVYQQDVYQNNGTTLMSRTVNTPSVINLETASNNQRYFPYVSSTTTDTYEVGGSKNGAWITSSTASFNYDNYGNVTSSTSSTTDKDSSAPVSPTYGTTWTKVVTNTISPDTGNWCLGLPSQTTVQQSATGVTAITRTTSFTPDYVNCRVTGSVVEPSSTVYKVTTSYGFDAFGNVNSVSVIGKKPDGTDMATRTTTTNWGTTGQFPINSTNAEGHYTQAGYNYTLGVQTSATDANGLVTSWTYDNFGRKATETRPDSTSTTWSYNDCASVSGGCQNGDPASGVTSINKMVVIQTSKDSSGTALRDEWTYLDQLGRTIVTKSKSLSGGYTRVGLQYNALGQAYRQTAPCDAASCTVYWTTNAYDALGRIATSSQAVSASDSTLKVMSVAYQGMTTVTTDAQSKTKTQVTDPNGWLRKSIDHNGYYQAFTYDAFGSLKTVTDSSSNALFSANYGYGASAFQTQTSDMDLGTWTYTVDALGEVTTYTDAKSQVFTMTYDKLSRPLTRYVSGEGTATWTWGSTAASYNIGQLQSVTSTGGTTEAYTYDSKSRLSQKAITADSSTYNYDYTYSSTTGLLDTLTYPTSTSSYRLKLQYLYQNGILNKVKDYNTSTVFWQGNSANARGQITQETLGNGIVTNRAYDVVNGFLNSIQSGVGGGTGVQNEGYLWDKVGNLTLRQNNTLGLNESFCYDNLYRLVKSSLSANCSTGTANLTLTYDDLGNIKSRSDIASGAAWTYHATKKHAVTQAGSSSYSYTYDANGNAITRNGYTIGWSKYNYPTSIAASGETVTLSYDANNSRWKQVYVKGTTTETTLYLGGLLQKMTSGTATDWRHNIYANGKLVSVYSRKSSGTNTFYYTLEDHQGSLAKITSSAGATTVSESFTAYGNRRSPSTWSGSPTSSDLTTLNGISRIGYTEQEVLGAMGLNHMNGRVQDAITGRFLSADPYITEPGNTQNYNRYSYVYNNPMSYTDPSGFNCEDGVLADADQSWVCADPYNPSEEPLYDNPTYSPGSGGDTGGGVESERPKSPQTEKPKTCPNTAANNDFTFDDVVDFSAGLGDALLLGFGDDIRGALDIGGVDMSSTSYEVGSWSSFAFGAARLTYAGAAKGYSIVASSGASASAFRESLKSIGRLGQAKNWRKFDPTGKTDAQLRAGAGKTNKYINAYGAGVTAAGAYGATRCEASR